MFDLFNWEVIARKRDDKGRFFTYKNGSFLLRTYAVAGFAIGMVTEMAISGKLGYIVNLMIH